MNTNINYEVLYTSRYTITPDEYTDEQRKNLYYTSRIVKDSYGIPVVEIAPIDPENAERSKSFWLAPFRGYCFQVSGTIDGHGSFGQSPVVGLMNIIDAQYNSTAKYGRSSNYSTDSGIATVVLTSMAYMAIAKNENYGMFPHGVIIDDRLMDQFITYTRKWCESLR